MGKHSIPEYGNSGQSAELIVGEDAAHPITIHTYPNAYASQQPDEPVRTIVLDNGAFRSEGTSGVFIQSLLHSAARHRQAVRFVTYDDPYEPDGYNPEARMSRFKQVMLHTADNSEGDLYIIGHSIGGVGALQVGLELQDDERVGGRLKGVTMLTPTGCAPRLSSHGREMAGWVLREGVLELGRLFRSRLGGLAVLANLSRSIARRFLEAPRAVGRMAMSSLFETNDMEQVAEVCSQAKFDINVVLAERDAFVPALETERALARVIPRRHMRWLPGTTHLSVITDSDNGGLVYDFINERAGEFERQLREPGQRRAPTPAV